MAQVNFPFSDLKELIPIEKEEAIESLTMLGFPTEELENGDLTVEVTPNRPDALCVEGVARTLRFYKTGKCASYAVGKASISAVVDKSVAAVRPEFGGAVVRGISISDSFLRSLMQIQEKLHETLGRKRRKVAIGMHDLDKVAPPFRYFACGKEEVSFVPLDRKGKMTPLEILLRHEKGMAYAHLVGDMCPMIEDKNGNVLSFPPIINGELTRVTPETKNVFIDVTGTSADAVRQSVNIIASMLAERGGRIEEILINGDDYPLLRESKWPLPVKDSQRLLGIPLDKTEVASLLSKMGYRIEGDFAYAPGFRADIINEVDLIEDVAIAYGFNNFEPKLPEFSSIGHQDADSPYHELLVGLGFDEVMSWTLSNQKVEGKAKIPASAAVEIENPLTSDFTQFRRAILPNHLSILGESKSEKLPIRIYEVGPIATPEEGDALCIASMHPKADFSEIKGVVLSLAESTGKAAEVKKEESETFLKGRCAALYLDGNRVGLFGEIAPDVLAAFGIEQPVCAAEIEL
ncbi:Phenylalanine--tRNA ligase beta subunit [uncultured archaeon]|nr:Phenylalanine--tRNA ligase beta subunit [uncultured archaeon]